MRSVSELVTERLRRRVRTQGPEPLVTYYDLSSGERTELSATTFANWVDKTSNLLVDELMLEPDDRVELALAGPHPGHWVTLVWAAACWQVGLAVSHGRAGARLIVCGPDWTPYADAAPDVVACSLHPLGLGFGVPPPAPILDYTLEVRGQPDQYAATPRSGLALAWDDPIHRLTQADLLAGLEGPALRRLVSGTDPWTTLREALLRPLVTGGSAVVVAGDDPDALPRICSQERVDP